MALIEINKNPSRRELLWFGALFALFFGLIGGLIWWKLEAPVVASVLWSVASGITLLYCTLSPIRKSLYLGWMLLVFPIGWVVSHALLAFIYYLVVTPIGRLMRLFGRDPKERRFDRGAESYWMEHDPVRDPVRYFRQF